MQNVLRKQSGNMRRRHCDFRSGSKRNHCSTWYRWLLEAKRAKQESISTEEEEEGKYDGSIERNSSDETGSILRNENEQKHKNGRRSVGRSLRDHTEFKFWDFPSSESFDYFSGSLHSLRGHSVSSQEVGSTCNLKLV